MTILALLDLILVNALKRFLKSFQVETILNIPFHVLLDKVDVWFQDEARLRQQNTTARVWATKATRPRVVRQQQFKYAYLFGAVCPSTGETAAIVAPFSNSEAMVKHMTLISKRTVKGGHAVVIMDGADWHQKHITEGLDNVSIIKLPPYSPELNPIEQVWQWMRKNELANTCFNGYDDIVDECCRAWNNFRSDKLGCSSFELTLN